MTLQVGVFSHFWPSLHGSGHQSNRPFFGSSFFQEIRLKTSFLESLIGFPA